MSTNTTTKEDILNEYMAYPFETDEVYQQGLASMFANGAIDPNAPPYIKDEMTLRSKVFYFNRVTGNDITLEQIKRHIHGDESESRILTFAELQDLIQSGKVDQIPNNKIIPDKLNERAPSESKSDPRKKPWELTSVESQ